MSDEIRRKTETYIAGKLRLAVPTINSVSMNGGEASGDAEPIEPPFAVVTVNEAEKIMTQSGNFAVSGVVQMVTHMDEHTPSEHSVMARQIYAALADIQPEVAGDFLFHGIDVGDLRGSEDSSLKARVDNISFTAGVGG